MLALYNFIPLYCPSCGTPTRLERADNLMSGKFKAHQALDCAICGVMYQLASQTDILRAATASVGDMVEYFLDEDDNQLLEDTQQSLIMKYQVPWYSNGM